MLVVWKLVMFSVEAAASSGGEWYCSRVLWHLGPVKLPQEEVGSDVPEEKYESQGNGKKRRN